MLEGEKSIDFAQFHRKSKGRSGYAAAQVYALGEMILLPCWL